MNGVCWNPILDLDVFISCISSYCFYRSWRPPSFFFDPVLVLDRLPNPVSACWLLELCILLVDLVLDVFWLAPDCCWDLFPTIDFILLVDLALIAAWLVWDCSWDMLPASDCFLLPASDCFLLPASDCFLLPACDCILLPDLESLPMLVLVWDRLPILVCVRPANLTAFIKGSSPSSSSSSSSSSSMSDCESSLSDGMRHTSGHGDK